VGVSIYIPRVQVLNRSLQLPHFFFFFLAGVDDANILVQLWAGNVTDEMGRTDNEQVQRGNVLLLCF